MSSTNVKHSRAAGFAIPAGVVALGLAANIAACQSNNTSPQPGPSASAQPGPSASAEAPKAAVKAAAELPKRLLAHNGLPKKAVNAATCPEVTPGKIYRMIAGIDTCPQLMQQSDIDKEFHDPWGQNVLNANQNQLAKWPTDFDSIVNTATSQNATLSRHAVLLGEGGQMPKAPNHDLRFVITWGDKDFNGAQLFFSARPPAGAEDKPKVLEVIGFDSQKQKLNFYHFDNANDDDNDSTPRTWIWTGDSSFAQDPKAGGNGCFMCHLDGGLNMKELTVPWNNWNSVKAPIDPSLVGSTDSLVNQILKNELKDAYDFEPIIRATNTTITGNWVKATTQSGTISKADLKAVLARLFGTSTINMASSPTKASGTDPISSLPNDFFLFDTAFRDPNGIGLSYGGSKLDTGSPGNLGISISRDAYSAFLTKYNVQMRDLDNSGQKITYEQPGATFFPFFVPTPPYEDALAISAMIQQKIISPKFAAAALMVDFANPIFSEIRQSLLARVDELKEDSFKLDGQDIPNRLMTLVTLASLTQPLCQPAGTEGIQGRLLDKCTAEQQLVFWWARPDQTWKSDMQTRLQFYLDAVKAWAGGSEGPENYLTLMIARGAQFSRNPVVCNLDEFPLLLPTTSMDDDLKKQSWQLQSDGRIAPKAPYTGCGN